MIPQRTCVGCRRRDDQNALVRLVREGDLIIDGTAPRLPGRGAYVHRGCLELAIKRHALRRALGAGAEVSPAVLG